MREAGLRVPKPLGSSVGIVGGLVIGETAVPQARQRTVARRHAVTVITGYTIPKLYEPMAVLRLTFILVGGIWGVWGVLAGLYRFYYSSFAAKQAFPCRFWPRSHHFGFPPCGMCLYARMETISAS